MTREQEDYLERLALEYGSVEVTERSWGVELTVPKGSVILTDDGYVCGYDGATTLADWTPFERAEAR
jgi:hypothetical protein